MSDFYEDRDSRFDDDARGRQRRRRSQRLKRYDDDAWGMAYNEDLGDGASADVEDWAAGMVDEEGRRYRANHRDYRDQMRAEVQHELDDLGPVRQDRLPRRGSKSRLQANADLPLSGSSALDRANQLLRRYSRLGSSPAQANPGFANDQSEAPPRPKRTGDFIDSLFDLRLDGGSLGTIPTLLIVALIVVCLVAVACVGAAWITAAEIRDMMGWTG
jgi:hypothetical protein